MLFFVPEPKNPSDVSDSRQPTLGEYVPLHHPDRAAGGAVSIAEVNKLPAEPRRLVPESLIALSKQLGWIEGTRRGALLLLQHTSNITFTWILI